MARYIPPVREKKRETIIRGPKPSLEDTYYRFLNPYGKKWLFVTNNDVWLERIAAEELYRNSNKKSGSVSEDFYKFLTYISDVRMFSWYSAAIYVDLRTETDVDYFIGKATQFGMYVKKIWYGELPTDHFPYSETQE